MAQTPLGAKRLVANKIGISLEEYLAHLEAGEKWCMKCRAWKPCSAFISDRSRGDGLSVYCAVHRHVVEPKSTKGRVSTFKGHTHTKDAKEKMSLAKQGMQLRLGKEHTLETRIRISQRTRERTPRGEQCHSYKDGNLTERRDQRFSRDYKRWRFDVFARDHFTCQECGDNRGGNLIAHHVKPFADFPELRFEVSNGLTLCKTCHDKLHTKK